MMKIFKKAKNSLYREFSKDFKRRDKKELKNLTYTQLEVELCKELSKINNLIEEKKKIEYHFSSYRVPLEILLNPLLLIFSLLGICLSILSFIQKYININDIKALLNFTIFFTYFYLFFFACSNIVNIKINNKYKKEELYRKMKLSCIDKMLNKNNISKVKVIKKKKAIIYRKNII